MANAHASPERRDPFGLFVQSPLNAEIRMLEAQLSEHAAKRDLHRAKAEVHRQTAGLHLSQRMLLRAIRCGERDPLLLRALLVRKW